MKKISKKKLKARADKLFSERIRSRRICQLLEEDHIECSGVLQCAHIIGRSNHRLRWDEENALSICQAHHFYYTNHPWEWQELIKTLWHNKYDYLNSVRNEIWDKDIESVISKLTS